MSGSKAQHEGKTPIQAGTSTVTYVRRTLECMIFNVILTNDDQDGNAPLEFITGEQLAALSPALKQLTEAELTEFLAVMKVNTTADILTQDYSKAVERLKEKMRAKGKLK